MFLIYTDGACLNNGQPNPKAGCSFVLERWDGHGLQVRFWRIPREWNTEADSAAKQTAAEDERGEYGAMKGVLV